MDWRYTNSNVLTSLICFATMYALLFVSYPYFGSRIVCKGPNFNLPIPGIGVNQPAIDTTPGEFVPDERPVEAQQ